MIDINPETVCFLITRAVEFHVKEQVVFPETPGSPTEDWAMQVLADHSDDPCLAEFESVMNDLEPRQQQIVVALMWLGREDFSVDEWDFALSEAKRYWTPETSSYLMAHPMLADYLREGLELMGYRCEE
jgi:hypothetical protein